MALIDNNAVENRKVSNLIVNPRLDGDLPKRHSADKFIFDLKL